MRNLERLNARRIDTFIPNAKLLNEFFNQVGQSEAVRYVIGAMQPIDPAYTAATYDEGERVRNQLEKRLTERCSYKYQGSVTNDTHIRAKSDIDLLVLIEKFFSLEPPQTPTSPYQGNPVQDLQDLRSDVILSLDSAFPEVDVDTSGSKAVSLEGGSLRRKIDVVPANWYNTINYTNTGLDIYRGIHILDSKKNERLSNTPFLHNHKILEKNKRCGGNVCKAARLMKSLKYDSNDIGLSSYDIVSIAYNIPQNSLNIQPRYELALLQVCHDFCEMLYFDDQYRLKLLVPDEHRAIFSDGHATKKDLGNLVRELKQLGEDVINQNTRSFKKLSEARELY